MISRTSNISLILGPINGHFWTRGPRIYGFYYTKILQKILESTWEHLGKYYFPYMRTNIFGISDSHLWKYYFQGCPHHCLVFVKYFGDIYGVPGSIFSRLVGLSRNHPKSVAIDQESLISHFGIIKAPSNPMITLKTWKQQIYIVCCRTKKRHLKRSRRNMLGMC